MAPELHTSIGPETPLKVPVYIVIEDIKRVGEFVRPYLSQTMDRVSVREKLLDFCIAERIKTSFSFMFDIIDHGYYVESFDHPVTAEEFGEFIGDPEDVIFSWVGIGRTLEDDAARDLEDLQRI